MRNKPLLLIILDGWGYRKESSYNAISLANTPNWDNLWQNYPHTLLDCSGNAVGLPENQMGNSEVGHLTIGSGRVIYQDLTKINLSITQQTFFNKPNLINFIQQAISNNHALHLMGLLSPGGVHAHEEHFYATLKLCANLGLKKVYIHAFLDGRDTPPTSAKASLTKLISFCQQINLGEIISITGRFYAMDRDQRWERTQATYDLLLSGISEYIASDPITALEQAYARGETDEFVKPTKILLNYSKTSWPCLAANDQILFLNFRADRTRQLCYAFTQQLDPNKINFNFNLARNKPLHLMTMTEYAADLTAAIVFPKDNLTNTLGEYLAQQHLTQLRLAETEKYAHVTFFFNGGKDTVFPNEDRLLIPSPKVTTYDLQPTMSAKEITKELISAIHNQTYDVIICNFANADMVGHTGNLTATITAVETIDACLGEITTALLAHNGEALITADHGNAEQMQDPATLQPHTAHTTSQVPLLYIGKKELKLKQDQASLADVAPSILTLLELAIPAEMTGKSLL